MYVQKQARIFRCGSYPGKGPGGSDFTVTLQDLLRIAAGTTHAAAIHAHDETNERLDYGMVDGLHVRGNELWGTLNLFPDALPFLERNGLKSLSAGIPFDKSRLAHIGFTRRPQIADAAMFSQAAPGIAYFSLAEDLPEQYPLTKEQLDKIPQSSCAGADKGYPCDTKEHLAHAVALFHQVGNPDSVRHEIIAIAIKKGWTSALPDEWLKDEADYRAMRAHMRMP